MGDKIKKEKLIYNNIDETALNNYSIEIKPSSLSEVSIKQNPKKTGTINVYTKEYKSIYNHVKDELLKDDVFLDELREQISDILDTTSKASELLSVFQKTFDTNTNHEEFKNYIQSVEIDSNLAQVLKDMKVTQNELAEAIGVNRNTIINIIKNPNSVSLINARKISIFLNKSVDDLFPNKD